MGICGISIIMWGFVVLLAVWMTYVETEMPNRTNECEFDNSCELFTEEEDNGLKD